MVAPVPAPDILDFAPERVLEPRPRRSLAARLGTACGDGLLSLSINAAVIGWLAQVGWPLRSAEAPSAVSVEIVDHMPGDGSQAPSAGEQASGTRGRPSREGKARQAEAKASPEASPAPPQPVTAAEPGREPDTKTAEATQAPSSPVSTSPASTTEASPPSALASQDEKTPSKAFVPPPPEHPDSNPQPRLVEAPKPPAASETPLTSAPTETPAPPDAAPAAEDTGPKQPAVLSSPLADEPTHQSSASQPDAAPPLTAEQKRQADSTAKLAAALPFGSMVRADPFQARLGQGPSAAESYRGSVYATFAKGNDLVEAARARHMRGQAVVAFSIDDHGNLASLAIAVSSGRPDVDETALQLIRRAAPFPAPPPGAQRSFSPAIGFGLDE